MGRLGFIEKNRSPLRVSMPPWLNLVPVSGWLWACAVAASG